MSRPQRQMTVAQLREAIKDAPDDSLVMFDTEAQKYDCHMIYIGSAFVEDILGDATPALILY